MNVLIALFVVFVILNTNEIWWRLTKRHSEFSRKFVHILVGAFAAFWPFFMDWYQIRLISLAFLAVVLVSKSTHLFKSIHSVERTTYGEVFFALSFGVTTFLTSNHWVYAAAILQMGLADGLAAIIGVKYGKKSRYKILGSYSSVIGTVTFAAVSIAILVFCNQLGHLGIGNLDILKIAILATFIENIGIKGSDNLLIPVTVAALITRLQL